MSRLGRRLRSLEPLTTLLVLACFGVTAQTLFFGRGYFAAGAVGRALLRDGEYWRIPVTFLLHGGWIHLLLNTLSLFFLGTFVVRACGRAFMLAVLFLAACAGLAASLAFLPGYEPRIGISGGVFGLLAIVAAVEWGHSRSFPGFLAQRNTMLVIFFLVLNAALAVAAEKFAQQLGIGHLDHAAHVGGFVFGLAIGFARFGRDRTAPAGDPRPRVRLVPPLVVAVLLGVAPIAYTCYPYWDFEFFRHRGDRALHRSDEAAAERAYARAFELRPGDAEVGARLALLRDDPALLEHLDPAAGVRGPVWGAYLGLAARRLESDPETARSLVERLRDAESPPASLWMAFAQQAVEAGRQDIAALAYDAAARALPESQAWQEAWQVLSLHAQRLGAPELTPEELRARARIAADVALRAAGGFAADSGLDAQGRRDLEHDVGQLAALVVAVVRRLSALPEPPEGLVDVSYGLHRLFDRLASNVEDRTRSATYLFESALWWSLALPNAPEATQGDIRAKFAAVLREARALGHAPLEDAAVRWFRAQGLPVPEPEPELAAPGDDG